jgi:uncharacterized membrane protein
MKENEPLVAEIKKPIQKKPAFYAAIIITTLVVIVVIVVVIVGWLQLRPEPEDPRYILSNAVVSDNVMIHLNGLQIAANESSSDSLSVMTGI